VPGMRRRKVEEIFCGGVSPAQQWVSRRARPSRAPVCGHDRHTQSLSMSNWLRAVRDVGRPACRVAAVRARGTQAHTPRSHAAPRSPPEAATRAAVWRSSYTGHWRMPLSAVRQLSSALAQ